LGVNEHGLTALWGFGRCSLEMPLGQALEAGLFEKKIAFILFKN
jgi:hypothetical protein